MLIPWQMLLEMVVCGGLIPAAAAAAIVLLARFSGWPTHSTADRWGAALALAGGFITGHVLLANAPWTPSASWHWLAYLMLAAAAAEVLFALSALPKMIVWGMRLGVSAFAAGTLVPEIRDFLPDLWLYRSAVFAAVLVIWCLLMAAARQEDAAAMIPPLALAALGGAMVVESAGFGGIAQESGVLAAALLGVAAVAWRWPEPELCQGLVSGIAVGMTGIMFSGRFHHASDVPTISFWLVLVAPCLIALTGLCAPSIPSRPWRVVVLYGAVLLPAGLAAVLAWLATANDAG